MPPKVYVSLVREGLTQLASELLQRQAWLSAADPSSFIEAVCQTYDDSGLDVALEKSEAAEYVGVEAVERLQQLSRALNSVDQSQHVESLIASDDMAAVRELAQAALDAISTDSGID
jgi:hypothetical protein